MCKKLACFAEELLAFFREDHPARSSQEQQSIQILFEQAHEAPER